MMTEQLLDFDFEDIGASMHVLVAELFPICRSITGPGVRETLNIIGRYVPVSAHEIPSGTEVFDWTIPPEWSIREAFILSPSGEKIVDFADNNLHVVNYSVPVHAHVTLDELQDHLYSIPNLPQAIPYVTSYYEKRWGFCVSQNQREALVPGQYEVVIDSDLNAKGSLTYGELIVPGQTTEEVFLSTYICHPSMANNELSGPVVASALYQWLISQPRRYTYRIVFVPETIGSLTYLSRYLPHLKDRVVAGYNLTCIGDDRAYSYLPSRAGNTLADRVALVVLESQYPDFKRYSFLDRGSDERQYCSPGVDLPVASLMRSKYREYPEYHTSLDDLQLVTPRGLQGGFELVRSCLELIEENRIWESNCIGEPQLGRHSLFPTLGTRESRSEVAHILDFLAYADGSADLVGIAEKTGLDPRSMYRIVEHLSDAELISER